MTAEKTYKFSLPAEPNDLVGRERDVADLRQLLAATRAVTLCGPGGIGKTRLAVHLAHMLAEDTAEYPDGIWFVELADVASHGTGLNGRPDPVTRRAARTLGVAEDPGRRLVDGLAGAIGPSRALLVLDNCEHLVEECADLCRLLLGACPGLRVLATSREPLRVPGENLWRVPPLETDEATRLFAVRAGAARPGFTVDQGNAAAVAGLCRALDGVPLALELAAARVRVLSVEQIGSRLADRFRLLSTTDRGTPPRQRTLRAAIDWSHELLDDPERVLLRRLSVFAGWTLDQAEQVCADDLLPEEDVLDLLSALVDKSLVVVDREVAGETRFRLLDSIRQYAAERLSLAGEETALRGRHRDAVLEEAELDADIALAVRVAPWAERVALFRKYDHEMENLRTALGWSLERGDAEEGLRLCTALRAYALPRGLFAECEEWMERFAPRRTSVPPRIWGAALVARSELAVEQRDFEAAARYAAEGVGPCRAAEDDVMVAAGLVVLAQTDASTGRFDAAIARLDEAVGVARSAGDRWNEGLAFITHGMLLVVQGRLREAQQMYETSLSLMRGLDQLWGASRALISLGQLARQRGDHAAARAYYEEALPILRDIEANPDIARCLGGIGRSALEVGDLPAARQALAAGLALSRSTGLRLGVARGLDAFSGLLAREGDLRGAVLIGGAAAALRDLIGQAPATGARLERMLEPIRRRLGERPVAQLWGEGRAMSPDDAVAYALTPPDQSSVPSPREPEPPRPTAQGAPVTAVTPPSTLTPREREIGLLIARGLSNRGIADELVISPATVARHVTNILTKLGFTSRAQIAAWAVDNLTGP